MSFFDMIPSEYMLMPTGTHASRQVEKKNFGLLESKCAYCGRTFYRRSHEVQYVRKKNGKEVRLCSWSHLCRWDEKNTRKRKPGGSEKTAQERIDERLKKIYEDSRLLESEEGRHMSIKERTKIKHRIAWRIREINELEADLRDGGN